MCAFVYAGIVITPTSTAAAGVVYAIDATYCILKRITANFTSGFYNTSVVSGVTSCSGLLDGIGTHAGFSYPNGLAITTRSSAPPNSFLIYVAAGGNGLVRVVNTTTYTVTTICGKTGSGSYVDGACGSAYLGSVNAFTWLADSYYGDGMHLVVATLGGALRLINLTSSTVTTIAGIDQTYSYADGVSTHALFNTPGCLSVNPYSGIIYVADSVNSAIRSVDPVSKTVRTPFILPVPDYNLQGALFLP